VIALIAALDRNHAIGRDGAMPWHLPDDLQRFKALTLGKAVLMGSRTARSIGRALPGRENLVLTRSGRAPFADQRAVASLAEALVIAQGTLVVAGGGEVYALALSIATDLHLTWIDTAIDGADAFFPQFDQREWTVTTSEAHVADARHAFAFRFSDYRRFVEPGARSDA